MKKFYAVVGNPPYQEQSVGEQKTFQKPVYDKFLDASFGIAERVELVHPARFLFNAGSTPKAWNQKMLDDKHLKVALYEPDSSIVFPSQEIKGGIVVTYRDSTRIIGPIGVFTPYVELNSILRKVMSSSFESFEDIVVTRTAYRLTDDLHKDHPEAISQLSNGHPYDMSTNIFDRLPEVFLDSRPDDSDHYIQIVGRTNNTRVRKWIKRRYVNNVPNLNAYKLLMSKANGTGAFGETLTSPFVVEPDVGSTESFISIGSFSSREEAGNTSKYINCKFVRALLGVAKATQDITPSTWRYVPLQDFTSSSDIDWSRSVEDIDHQLYRKYGLDDAEIEFIESHVKEMG